MDFFIWDLTGDDGCKILGLELWEGQLRSTSDGSQIPVMVGCWGHNYEFVFILHTWKSVFEDPTHFISCLFFHCPSMGFCTYE